MVELRTLLRLQALFAALSLGYLITSLLRRELTGDALSAAAIGPSIVMFIVYFGVLYIGKIGRVGWYRLGMIPALVLFGGGGVIANVLRYADSGLENYASNTTFAVAVAINGFGTALNIVALFGWFKTVNCTG
ncbi:hypothetical protein [Shimia aestuarii]|uniref:Uncharacterized protein n=1 Tax=Shimia aestuarii TaxID=254406 RepID=A0A1I4TFX4_9RHOB|nr:hypothetical protein [Shimia aestuarii]SFM75457.1 hypothetical protein SAMN04488042_11613 [Shimia aestuarii]